MAVPLVSVIYTDPHFQRKPDLTFNNSFIISLIVTNLNIRKTNHFLKGEHYCFRQIFISLVRLCSSAPEGI